MEKLSHFFESARIQDLPESYKVAQFPSPGATGLEIKSITWIEPREGGELQSLLSEFLFSPWLWSWYRILWVSTPEVVVKVSSCGLHASWDFISSFFFLSSSLLLSLIPLSLSPLNRDQIIKHSLLPHLKYPITPGSFAAGEIVQTGQNVKHLKLHHKVVGVAIHGGGCLAEYAVLNSDHVVQIKRKEGATQQVYCEVFEGSRVEGNTLSLFPSPE